MLFITAGNIWVTSRKLSSRALPLNSYLDSPYPHRAAHTTPNMVDPPTAMALFLMYVAMGYSFHIFTKFSRVGPYGNNFRPLERVISVMDLRDVITIHDNGSSTRRQPVIRTTYPSSNTSLFLFVLVIAQQPPENNSYKVTYHKNIY